MASALLPGTPASYIIPEGLPTGTYYARTGNSFGFLDQLYDNITCITRDGGACIPTTGLSHFRRVGHDNEQHQFCPRTGGRIFGTVTHSFTGAPLAKVTVHIYDVNGVLLDSRTTDGFGALYIGHWIADRVLLCSDVESAGPRRQVVRQRHLRRLRRHYRYADSRQRRDDDEQYQLRADRDSENEPHGYLACAGRYRPRHGARPGAVERDCKCRRNIRLCAPVRHGAGAGAADTVGDLHSERHGELYASATKTVSIMVKRPPSVTVTRPARAQAQRSPR